MNRLTNELFYRRPAERWTEGCPIGSGRLGAVIHGRVNEEIICLNEETIWMGRREDRSNPRAKKDLPELRRLLFEGKLAEAEALARRSLVSRPQKFGAFTPFADLAIEENDEPLREGVKEKYYSYTDYERRLDLSTGIVTVSYLRNGVRYTREYFASYPDNVIVIRFTNDGGVPMDLSAAFRRGYDMVGAAPDLETLIYEGTLCEGGVSFAGALRVLTDSGKAETNKIASDFGYMPPAMSVSRACGITFLFAARTDFDGGNPRDCLNDLSLAAEKGFDRLKEDHVRDFREQYGRFALSLGSEEGVPRDTLEWLDEAHHGLVTPAFAELVMNAERYYFISASREGCKPSNLQGVWNQKMHPSWESDYHTNVNLQINYWPSHAWGLHEDVLPLIDWIESIVPSGSQAVRQLYGTRGWTVHHASDLFGYATPVFDVVGIWPLGGPWLCRHLYEYYLYTGDENLLRTKIYPIMKGSCEFLLDFLIPAPENSPLAGMLVTNPSVSPENIYIRPDTEEHGMLAFAPTMDVEICMDFFEFFVEALEILRKKEPDLDTELLTEAREALRRLPPIRVSSRYGGIMEWVEDYEDEDPGHRHVSHLYGAYPGHSIDPGKTPDLAAAAQRTVNRKMAAGYHGQGWCLGWIASILARLGNGEGAFEMMTRVFREQYLPNLMVNSHGQPQVGDAMAVPAAMLETLAWSHGDEIVLLPCLPEAWPEGEVKGMCLRGGYTLSMRWEKGRIVKARLEKTLPGREKAVKTGCGGSYRITRDEKSGGVLVEPQKKA